MLGNPALVTRRPQSPGPTTAAGAAPPRAGCGDEGRAATGRVNLVAEAPGLLRVNAGIIDQLNAIDEALTLGTLPDYTVVAPKDLVATIKIIPFSVPGTMLAVAEAVDNSSSLAAPQDWRRAGAARFA